MFADGITGTQVAFGIAGFFGVMWIVALWRLTKKAPREKRWYSTEIPSTLHIEHEA